MRWRLKKTLKVLTTSSCMQKIKCVYNREKNFTNSRNLVAILENIVPIKAHLAKISSQSCSHF